MQQIEIYKYTNKGMVQAWVAHFVTPTLCYFDSTGCNNNNGTVITTSDKIRQLLNVLWRNNKSRLRNLIPQSYRMDRQCCFLLGYFRLIEVEGNPLEWMCSETLNDPIP